MSIPLVTTKRKSSSLRLVVVHGQEQRNPVRRTQEATHRKVSSFLVIQNEWYIYQNKSIMRYKILDQHGTYFLTITIVEWIDLFTRRVFKDLIIDSLQHCQKEKGLMVNAYVIMPSHLHLIVQAGGEEGLSKILQSFKSYTAKQILKYLKNKEKPESRREWLLNHFAFNARKNRTHSQHQVWQKDNHPIELYSPWVIRQKLRYLHYNPVVDGMVGEAADYIYSSASNYRHGTGAMEVTIMEEIWNDIGYVPQGRRM